MLDAWERGLERLNAHGGRRRFQIIEHLFADGTALVGDPEEKFRVDW